jgi:hypothetical protein
VTGTLGSGVSAYETAAQLDVAVQAVNAGDISLRLGETTTRAADALAQWNRVENQVQTRPTGIGATLLMTTLENATGEALDSLYVWYDFGSWMLQEGEEVYGHRAYYSRTGAAGDWVLIPEFSDFLATPFAGERRLVAELDFGAQPWAQGDTLQILWADDNGSGGGDQSGTGP